MVEENVYYKQVGEYSQRQTHLRKSTEELDGTELSHVGERPRRKERGENGTRCNS